MFQIPWLIGFDGGNQWMACSHAPEGNRLLDEDNSVFCPHLNTMHANAINVICWSTSITFIAWHRCFQDKRSLEYQYAKPRNGNLMGLLNSGVHNSKLPPTQIIQNILIIFYIQ